VIDTVISDNKLLLKSAGLQVDNKISGPIRVRANPIIEDVS
jgi:hypothetical protein